MQRHQCRLLFAALAMIATAPTWAADKARLYRDSRLQIEFSIPAGWERHPCRYPQCLELRPRGQRNTDQAIRVYVKTATLEQALSEHILFEQRDKAWIKHGRFNEVEASPIANGQWKGFEAAASCGISDPDTGFHAGAGTCYTAILSNGQRAATIETDGFESTLEFAEHIKNSFRFLR